MKKIIILLSLMMLLMVTSVTAFAPEFILGGDYRQWYAVDTQTVGNDGDCNANADFFLDNDRLATGDRMYCPGGTKDVDNRFYDIQWGSSSDDPCFYGGGGSVEIDLYGQSFPMTFCIHTDEGYDERIKMDYFDDYGREAGFNLEPFTGIGWYSQDTDFSELDGGFRYAASLFRDPFNNDRLTIIFGRYNGITYHAFYSTNGGVSWTQDNTLATGLYTSATSPGYGSSDSEVGVWNDGGTLKAITGNTNYRSQVGGLRGFYNTGSGWIEDTAIANGLPTAANAGYAAALKHVIIDGTELLFQLKYGGVVVWEWNGVIWTDVSATWGTAVGFPPFRSNTDFWQQSAFFDIYYNDGWKVIGGKDVGAYWTGSAWIRDDSFAQSDRSYNSRGPMPIYDLDDDGLLERIHCMSEECDQIEIWEYTGSYVPQVFCTADWVCDGYDACNPGNEILCNSVIDNAVCGESYMGDYSEFSQVCVYNTEPVLNSITPDERIELTSGESQLYTSDVTDTDGDANYVWTLGGVEVSTSSTYQANWEDITDGIYTVELTVSDAEYSNSLDTILEIRAVGGESLSIVAPIVLEEEKADDVITPEEYKEPNVFQKTGTAISKTVSSVGGFFSKIGNFFGGLF